jgi:hypothetical protein
VAARLQEACTGLRGHLRGKHSQTDGQSLLLQLLELHTLTSSSTAPPSPAAVDPVQLIQQYQASKSADVKQFGPYELREVLAACSMACTADEVCSCNLLLLAVSTFVNLCLGE